MATNIYEVLSHPPLHKSTGKKCKAASQKKWMKPMMKSISIKSKITSSPRRVRSLVAHDGTNECRGSGSGILVILIKMSGLKQPLQGLTYYFIFYISTWYTSRNKPLLTYFLFLQINSFVYSYIQT